MPFCFQTASETVDMQKEKIGGDEMALSAVKIQWVSVSKVQSALSSFFLHATVKCWQIITTCVTVVLLFF